MKPIEAVDLKTSPSEPIRCHFCRGEGRIVHMDNDGNQDYSICSYCDGGGTLTESIYEICEN